MGRDCDFDSLFYNLYNYIGNNVFKVDYIGLMSVFGVELCDLINTNIEGTYEISSPVPFLGGYPFLI